MNAEMFRVEVYKIFSKRVVWIAMAAFLALYLVLNLQFLSMIGVRYTLEPVRGELTEAVQSEEFHAFVRDGGYSRSLEELRPYIPAACFAYIGEHSGNERAVRSLQSDLVRIVNNYFERVDSRAAWIEQLRQTEGDAAQPRTAKEKARAKLLQAYREAEVAIELNLETSANALIDTNHAAVFPCLIMLVVLAGLSGIYADEHTSGTEAALLTARRGRAGVFFAKLAASLVFACTVAIVMECFCLTVTALCRRAPWRSLSAASTFGLSLTLYEGSTAGFCARQVMGTLLAACTLACVTLCVSARSKNALIPFFAVGTVYGGTAVYANAIAFPDYLSAIWSLPGELSPFMLQTQVELVAKGRYTGVFGLLIPTLAANVLFQLLVCAVSLALCYRSYTGKQMRDA